MSTGHYFTLGMDKNSKKEIVKDLKRCFERSQGVIVTHYLGLDSTELSELRNKVKGVGSKFCVAKNSLAKLATKKTDYEELNDFFSGPIALVFSDDPLAGIKVIKKYSDENEKLKFVSACYEKKIIEQKEFETLAKLPALEELRSNIVSYLKAPHQQLVNILNGVGTEIVGVIENYSKK